MVGGCQPRQSAPGCLDAATAWIDWRSLPPWAVAVSLLVVACTGPRPQGKGLIALQRQVQQYRSGQMPPLPLEEWQRIMRAQDRRGNWWSVEPGGGRWLWWNGAAWQPATPPAWGGGLGSGCGLVLIVMGVGAFLIALAALLVGPETLAGLQPGGAPSPTPVAVRSASNHPWGRMRTATPTKATSAHVP